MKVNKIAVKIHTDDLFKYGLSFVGNKFVPDFVFLHAEPLEAEPIEPIPTEEKCCTKSHYNDFTTTHFCAICKCHFKAPKEVDLVKDFPLSNESMENALFGKEIELPSLLKRIVYLDKSNSVSRAPNETELMEKINQIIDYLRLVIDETSL